MLRLKKTKSNINSGKNMLSFKKFNVGVGWLAGSPSDYSITSWSILQAEIFSWAKRFQDRPSVAKILVHTILSNTIESIIPTIFDFLGDSKKPKLFFVISVNFFAIDNLFFIFKRVVKIFQKIFLNNFLTISCNLEQLYAKFIWANLFSENAGGKKF